VTVINTATSAVYAGSSLAAKVYAGTNLVWVADPTTSWVNAVIAAGGTVTGPRETLYRTLINGLVTDNNWSNLDRIWVFSAENHPSALIDLKLHDAAVEVGTPDFLIDRGFASVNGTSSYVDTTYNTVTDAVNFSQNSGSIGIWLVTSPTIGADAYIFGNYDGGSGVFISFNPAAFFDGQPYFRLSTAGTPTPSNFEVGFIAANRSVSTNVDMYHDGALDLNVASTSGAPPNLNLFVGAVNNSGTASNYSPLRVAAFVVGGSRSATQHLALYNRLRTFMTAVGVP
jgi:hypothetical protein